MLLSSKAIQVVGVVGTCPYEMYLVWRACCAWYGVVCFRVVVCMHAFILVRLPVPRCSCVLASMLKRVCLWYFSYVEWVVRCACCLWCDVVCVCVCALVRECALVSA